MYCHACGAPNGSNRFCTSCGARLAPAPIDTGAPGAPAITGTTTVTVNVGGPVLVAGKGIDRVVLERGHSVDGTSGWEHNDALIIAALVLFFPVGIPWMWAAARWKTETKWAVTGAFFWPLWIRQIWEQEWSEGLKVAAAAVLVVSYALLFVTHLALAGVLLVGLPGFIWALNDSRQEDEPDSSMRDVVVALVERCDEAIVEIERGLGVDLLPIDSPIRKRYMHGLEMRREAVDLLSSTDTVDLAIARRKASEALSNFQATREALNSAAT